MAINKDAILTILGGLTLFLLFKQYGVKKNSCGCNEKENIDSKSEDDIACEEAVDMIMAERKKTLNLSSEDFSKMRGEEIIKCKNS